jgi:hypothetical protein
MWQDSLSWMTLFSTLRKVASSTGFSLMEMQSHLEGLGLGQSHLTGRIPVDEMWRREFAASNVRACNQRRRIVADGAFAVGAGNVDGLPRKLDIPEKLPNALQARLDHGSFL